MLPGFGSPLGLGDAEDGPAILLCFSLGGDGFTAATFFTVCVSLALFPLLYANGDFLGGVCLKPGLERGDIPVFLCPKGE
jgi:hypothetical protein